MGEQMGDVLAALCKDPRMVAAWRACINEPTTFQDFEGFEMPDGLTHAQAWLAFQVLRREAGVVFGVQPFFPAEKNVSWMCTPKSTLVDMYEISRACASGSSTDRYIRAHRVEDSGLLPFVRREVESAARRDGLTLYPGLVERIWSGAQEPQRAVERVMANFRTSFLRTPELAERPLTMGVVQMLHDSLLEGVSEADLGAATGTDRHDDFLDHAKFDEALTFQTIRTSLGDTLMGDRTLSPIFESIQISFAFWDLAYFPQLNALTEYLVRAVFFHRAGMPALAFVPFSRMCDNLPDGGFLRRSREAYRYEREKIGMTEGIDCTVQYCGAVAVYREGIEVLEHSIQERSRAADENRARFETVPGINKRQVAFLMRAAGDNTRAYTIADYQQMFDVAHGTANNDLFWLVDRGLLVCRKVNRAFTFRYV